MFAPTISNWEYKLPTNFLKNIHFDTTQKIKTDFSKWRKDGFSENDERDGFPSLYGRIEAMGILMTVQLYYER